MKKLLLFTILAISMLGCSNPNKGMSTTDSTTTSHDVDYSKLIELTAVDGGWHGLPDANNAIPLIRISVKNISGKPIEDLGISVKCRFIENNEVVAESEERLQHENDIPWNEERVKRFSISRGKVYENAYTHNIKAEIYDDNNNLLWKGDIENKLLKDD